MIEAKGVSLKYRDGTLALRDIGLKVSPGELIFITGPSGSGKTSLLKLLIGMEYPTSGSLNVLGQVMESGEEKGIRKIRRAIGPVFQELKLVHGRSSLENVMMGIRFLDFSKKEIRENSRIALEKVGLAHKAHTPVENLSWGEAQRVSIARAIARKPSLILADEPTGNLDKDNAVNILNILSSFSDGNTAVLITTHATHLIENLKNVTILHMDNGSMSIEHRGESE